MTLARSNKAEGESLSASAGTGRRESIWPTARPVSDAYGRLALAHARLTSAHLELTKRCNLRCCHCYVAGDATELDTSRWLDVVDELESEGCLHVSLTGGELALRSDWFDIAQRVKSRHMTLTILTNGTLLSDSAESVASLNPALVAVSLYGGDAAAHERVTGVPGSFELTLRTLEALLHAGVRCRVSCTLMPETLPEFPRIIDLANTLGCEYMFDPTVAPRSDGDTSVLAHRLSASDLREFFVDERILTRSREGSIATHPGELPSREPANCGAGITGLTIEANGDALPCAGFRPRLGNVAQQSIHGVWSSAAAAAHRERMRAPLIECETCGLRNVCTMRCPRLALLERGSVSARSSRACDLAEANERLRAELLGLSLAADG